MEINSSDFNPNYDESDYDMEDDDDQVFEVNVNLGIEGNMEGQLKGLSFALGSRLGCDIMNQHRAVNEIQTMRTQGLCIVLLNLMMLMPIEEESF